MVAPFIFSKFPCSVFDKTLKTPVQKRIETLEKQEDR